MDVNPPFAKAGARIFVLDDEDMYVRQLVGLLKREGYELCVGMTHPRAAVADFHKFEPDLLLLDWHMEAMSGAEVMMEMQKIWYGRSVPPVIVLTADSSPVARQEALSAGACDFLTKPFDQMDVLLRIKNILRMRHLHCQLESQNLRLEEMVHDRTAKLRGMVEDLKALQHQVLEENRMRALASMAGGIAHNINNSLTVIRGYSELYSADPGAQAPSGDMVEAFGIIALAAEDAAKIVRRLREFYRPFNDAMGERKVTDLKKLLEEAVELTRPKWETQARGAGISIDVGLEVDAGLKILAVPTEIREAIINLIFNAVDAMPKGGRIRITARLQGEQILVGIEDTGIGMTAATRERCLEPFYTTKGEKGTGLGLSVAYGILRRHGGSLQIKTELNEGTCMTLTLPRHVDESGLVDAPLLHPVTRHLRILVVDDDPLVCSVLSRLLEGDEHSVTSALNGSEALTKFSRTEFDVVITDRVMPQMSGDQLASEIRNIRPGAPIILLTGFEVDRAASEFDGTLLKPVTSDSLRRVIGEVMLDRPRGPIAA